MDFGNYGFKLLLCCWLLVIYQFSPAQINTTGDKGKVFKTRPEKPYENTDYSGRIIVTKGLYGLTFHDRQLSQDTKSRVEKFFKRHLNGYTDLKKYHLQIFKKNGRWYINNTEI